MPEAVLERERERECDSVTLWPSNVVPSLVGEGANASLTGGVKYKRRNASSTGLSKARLGFNAKYVHKEEKGSLRWVAAPSMPSTREVQK